MIKFYNTLTRKKEEFKPLNPPEVKFYMCGPTVYDYFHIGNARSFVMSDIIRRYLEYRGYDVKYVMNLTDIDDKIIKRANEKGVKAEEIAAEYSDAFMEDLKNLRVKPADVYPRATDHIQEMIDLVKKLEDKGIAYNSDGNVFYDISKFEGYGKLSGKKTDELEAGSRVEVLEDKRNPLDFTLWKKAKEGEPQWKSPWGEGRPGWHLECSVMGCKHLGETFDIHGGGIDLIFPHHENEIAQSEAATGKQFVRYWLHLGFLNIDDEKMSKSLGNFFTAREVLKKYPAEVIRFFFAQTLYSAPLNFSDEGLNAAKKGLDKIENLVHKVNKELETVEKEGGTGILDFDKYYNDFNEVMDDDFNTPRGLAVISNFIRDVNTAVSKHPDEAGRKFYEKVKGFLEDTAVNIFGITSFEKEESSDGSLKNELIDLLIEVRLDAKKNKNYDTADKIRDKLKELGIILEDTKDKTAWKKVKK